MDKKWRVHDVKGYLDQDYSVTNGEESILGDHKETMERVCTALNDFREWKTVDKDGQPIKSGDYIITDSMGKSSTAFFDWERDVWRYYQEVIAYRELPEPYKP